MARASPRACGTGARARARPSLACGGLARVAGWRQTLVRGLARGGLALGLVRGPHMAPACRRARGDGPPGLIEPIRPALPLPEWRARPVICAWTVSTQYLWLA